MKILKMLVAAPSVLIASTAFAGDRDVVEAFYKILLTAGGSFDIMSIDIHQVSNGIITKTLPFKPIILHDRRYWDFIRT